MQRRFIVVAAVLLAILGAVVAFWGVRQFSVEKEELNWLGGFLAGTAAPIWSVAGLLLVYVAYLTQREQIALQEEEIRATGSEIARQRFDTTFFRLLEIHHRLVESISTHVHAYPSSVVPMDQNPLVEEKGRECIANFYRRLKSQYDKTSNHSAEALVEAYGQFYSRDEHESVLSPYFGNWVLMLSNLQLVDSEAREFYLGILRSQMSGFEVALLLYHSLYLKKAKNQEGLVNAISYSGFLAGVDLSKLFDARHESILDAGAHNTVAQADG